MAGIKIIGVKVVDMCSKCRKEVDEIPKNKFGVPYEDKDIACVGCALGNPSKAQMNWEVMNEQAKEFIQGIPPFVNGIETELFFKGLRQTEYRRGKEDGSKEIKKFAEELKERIYRRLWASEFVHKEIDKLVEKKCVNATDGETQGEKS